MNMNGSYLLVKVIRSAQWMSLHSVHMTGLSYDKTHYDTLNLSKKCTNKEIRDAFISLSKKYHPDRNGSDPKNHARFVALNEAYSILSKPDKRQDYDLQIRTVDAAPVQNEEFMRRRDHVFVRREPNDEFKRQERYRNYRYDVRDTYPDRSSENIPKGKVFLFVFVLSMIGASLPLLIMRFNKNIAFNRELEEQILATATTLAAQEEMNRRWRDEYSHKMKERIYELRREPKSRKKTKSRTKTKNDSVAGFSDQKPA